ncbi:MAG: hypothetical protein ACKPJD_02010, partial [Planctomycetaceae bacterium]
ASDGQYWLSTFSGVRRNSSRQHKRNTSKGGVGTASGGEGVRDLRGFSHCGAANFSAFRTMPRSMGT